MRAPKGAARNKAKKRIFKAAKGFVGGRRRLLKSAKETLIRAGMFAFRHRRTKKRDFRRLWITRINAAARQEGMTYSQFMHGLRLAEIELDRKILADIAVRDAEAFRRFADNAREALAAAA